MNKNNIAITLGDPAGIGAEVTVKSLENIDIPFSSRILLIGDKVLLKPYGLDKKIPVFKDSKQWLNSGSSVSLLDADTGLIGKNNKIKYASADKKYGLAAYNYIIKACELIKNHTVNKIITAPVNKNVISSAGFDFKGHTELFEKQFNTKNIEMMLFSGNLRFVLLTRHVALNKVSSKLTKQRLFSVIKNVALNMEKVLAFKNVKLGVAGLNPHLGDNGIIGSQENEIINPVISKLKPKYNIKGPLPLDVLVKLALNKKIDVIIAMYHDQALVPLKLLFPGRGVNLTLGLPFIRTSPMHGTAYDIAGKNMASSYSMEETLKFTLSV